MAIQGMEKENGNIPVGKVGAVYWTTFVKDES